ncbi:MAG: hypothetical protein JXM69_07850 [Anaerolineae bacterium]|nr:hypothetical protein [Anaerolineae bacterium]
MADKDRIRVHIEGKAFNVVGGEFYDMLAAVKQINGRRFVSELKVWQLPGPLPEVRRQLEMSGYSLEGETPITESIAGDQFLPSQPGGDRVRVMVAGHHLAVVGGSFQEMLAVVKSLPGRRYDGEAKIWEIPGDLDVVQGMLQAAGYSLEGAEKIPHSPVPPMEPLRFGEIDEPPPFEEPDFFIDDDAVPFQPPDWLKNEPLPSPPEPPDWWEHEPPPPPDDFANDEAAPVVAPLAGSTRSPTPANRPGGDRIRIRVGVFPFVVSGGSFQEMLAAIKNIRGRRFDILDKVWEIPDEVGTDQVRQMLAAAGFEMERGSM